MLQQVKKYYYELIESMSYGKYGGTKDYFMRIQCKTWHYDMNKRTFYKERKINNRCFDFLSKQNIVVPLILDIYDSDNEAVLQRKTKSQKCLKIKAKI